MRYIAFYLLLLPVAGFGFNSDLGNNVDVLDVFSNKLRNDSTSQILYLDSARQSFEKHDFIQTVHHAERAYELLKQYQQDANLVECMLLLARSYKNLHELDGEESDFNNTLKYYLKTITFLESAESKIILPEIYKEYGDFYATLNLPKLTLENYEKALEIVADRPDDQMKEVLLLEIAFLYYHLNNLEDAIRSYNQLTDFYSSSQQTGELIEIYRELSNLYREHGDYDNALRNAKEVLMHYQETGMLKEQVTCYNTIGEISYLAGNKYQAKNAFIEYKNLVDKIDETEPGYKQDEIASLRYINALISLGKIYKSSTDDGYLSDYELALRHFHTAYDFADKSLHPEIASVILNQEAKIFFNNKDYKTCITYFNLGIYYAKLAQDLEVISDNYLMLARAYDRLNQWDEASQFYELNASYKDSLFARQEAQRLALDEITFTQSMDNLDVQERLNRIEEKERQELTIAEKELINAGLQRQIEMFEREKKLQSVLLANQELEKERINQEKLLISQQLRNQRNLIDIEKLRAEQEVREQKLKTQEADRQNKQQQIKILEQENTLARSRQAYYVLSIVLISLVLISIFVVYIQKRRANKILRAQKDQIEQQSEKLREAYQNLELLSTIGRDITASLIIEEIIETVYANINTLMDASVLGIGVYDEQNGMLAFPGVIERNEHLKNINVSLDTKNTLAAWCFLNQKEIAIDDFYTQYSDFINPEEQPYPGDGNATSIVYLPLTIGSKRLGVLTVQSFSESAFNEYHINIIRNIAIHTKIALENANVYKELAEKSSSLVHANRNISEKNLLIEDQNQQLLSMNEEKNNLMRILAHDLRNPLATSMSMTELLRYERNNLSAEQSQASEIIWRGLNRMNEMIRKILDVKAAESQKVLLEFDDVNANEIIFLLNNSFDLEAEQKHIKLHFNSQVEDPFIKVDRNYFNQIVENLVSNAIKFSPEHTNIFVEITEKNEHVRIIVRDEGPGIPEDEMPKLFKKYHKLSTKPTAGEQSIGLGLSIVKKYVEVMNGKVWCESQVGKGTSFNVEFRKELVSVS